MGEDEWDEGDHDGYQSHPDWDKKIDSLNDAWNLTEEENTVLEYALDQGLCDYFSAEDIIQCVALELVA